MAHLAGDAGRTARGVRGLLRGYHHVNNRQRVFVEEYLQCWNATEAARRSGYQGDANTVGPRLLANVGIATAIQARISEKALCADEVLSRLGEHARGDIGVFFKIAERWTDDPLTIHEVIDERVDTDKDGNPVRMYKVRQIVIDLERLRDSRYSRLVRKFGDTPKAGTSIELYDAQAALVKLGEHLGLFKDDDGDWRKELERAGVNAAEFFGQFVNILSTSVAAVHQPVDERGYGGSAAADS